MHACTHTSAQASHARACVCVNAWSAHAHTHTHTPPSPAAWLVCWRVRTWQHQPVAQAGRAGCGVDAPRWGVGGRACWGRQGKRWQVLGVPGDCSGYVVGCWMPVHMLVIPCQLPGPSFPRLLFSVGRAPVSPTFFRSFCSALQWAVATSP